MVKKQVATEVASSKGPKKTIEQPNPANQTKTKTRKRTGVSVSSFTGDQALYRNNPAASTEPDFSYDPTFLNDIEQAALIQSLEQLPWQKVTYTKYGKPRSTPRHTFCFGTPSDKGEPVEVSYMGSHYMTEAIPEWLDKLKAKVETKTGFQYNAIILNNYLDKGEYISWHTDDERFLQHTTVASISLGATRTFKVRTSPMGALCKLKSKPKQSEEEPTNPKEETKETSVRLASGSLAVLYHGIEHSLPKENPVPHVTPAGTTMTNRFNVTFRCLKPFHAGEKMSGWGNYYHYNRGSAYQINKK